MSCQNQLFLLTGFIAINPFDYPPRSEQKLEQPAMWVCTARFLATAVLGLTVCIWSGVVGEHPEQSRHYVGQPPGATVKKRRIYDDALFACMVSRRAISFPETAKAPEPDTKSARKPKKTNNNNNNNNNNHNQQPTTNNQQPTTNNQQPTTNNQQPTTNNQQPTTNNQQPTTNNQQPTTNNQQPTANSQQPTTNNQQPTTNNQQPTTNNQQPTTNNQQPTTNNQQPTTNNQQPTTNNNNNTRHPTVYTTSLQNISCNASLHPAALSRRASTNQQTVNATPPDGQTT